MTNVYRPLRAILLAIFFLLAARTASAQSWVRTGGPTGAQVSAMTVARDGTIYTGTDYGVLYRSTDEGESWTRLDKGLPVTSQHTVIAMPNGALFIATYDSGAYRSTDRGAAWTRLTTALDTGRNKSTSGMVTASDGTLFISKGERVFRSTDGGESWAPCAKPAGRVIGRLVIDSRDRLYGVGLGSGLGYNMHLLTSTDRGESWTDLGRPGDTMERFTVWVDPKDDLTALVSDTAIYRSVDGGLSWSMRTSPVPGRRLDEVYASGGLMLASANGLSLYRSTDDGITWSVRDSSMYDVLVEAFAASPNGKLYYGDWQEGVYRSDDGGVTWSLKRDGMTSSSAISMLAAGGRIYACTYYTGMYRSSDRGNTWQVRSPMINQRADAMARMVARGPGGDGDLLAGGYIAVYRSNDQGESWTKATSSGIVNAIASWRNGWIWVATTTGMRTSLDNGASWRSSNLSSKEIFTVAVDSGGVFYHSDEDGTYRAGSRLRGASASKLIAIHPNGTLYTAYGSITMSRDSGRTFFPRMLGPQSVVGITFARNGQTYVATSNDGVYRQTGDTTWEAVNDGLPRKQVTGIVADEDGYLYVSTWGNGVYRSAAPISASTPRDLPAPAGLDLTVAPNPFTARASAAFTLPVAGRVTVTLHDALGREVARPVDGRAFEAGHHEIAIEGDGLPAGAYHVMVRCGGRIASAEILRR